MVMQVSDKSFPAVKTVAAPAIKPIHASPPPPPSPKLNPIKRPEIHYDMLQEREKLQQAVSKLNAQLEKGKTGLGFSINNSVSIPIVTVQDKSTGKIVRQFPNQTSVSMAQSIDQLKGRLFSGKA